MTASEAIETVVSALGTSLPPAVVNAMASHIERLPRQIDLFRTAVPATTPHARTLVRRLSDAWAREPQMSPAMLAFGLRCSIESVRAAEVVSTETVLTGPSTEAVPARRTEQVVLELIDTTKKSLWIVSYVAYDVPAVLAALRRAMERGCRVKLLLELSKEGGGTLDYDDVVAIRAALPGATVLQWPMDKRGVTEHGTPGKLHTKCLIADGARLFVTSANLSPNAQEVNMELGVVIRGGTMPDRVRRHFEQLEARGELVPA